MIDNLKKKDCCGCSACLNICPVNAIEMIEDKEGFKYPKINYDKCIKCNKCSNTCPVINKQLNGYNGKAFACFNNDNNERINSSSGGIFSLIANYVFDNKGIVVAPAFDENFNVKHILIDNRKDLEKLMGSKYVQSDVTTIFKSVKKKLDEGILVLFSGTPCQISGIKKYLNKEYKNLILQDVACHGVPSPKLWELYVTYRKHKDNDCIKNISFRDKSNGWQDFQMKFNYKNKSYKKSHNNDPYFELFLNNISLRSSCYNCKFKDKYKSSDITLADYWGIENIKEHKFDLQNGISLVIINSDKGLDIFNNIKNKMTYQETDYDKALIYNSAIISSVEKPKKRDKFAKDLQKNNFSKLYKKYRRKNNIFKKIIKKILR